jgi:hypothetical protein
MCSGDAVIQIIGHGIPDPYSQGAGCNAGFRVAAACPAVSRFQESGP